MKYKVTWEIDLDADSPESAAKEAYAIQRDPASFAPVFSVRGPRGKSVLVDMEDFGSLGD